MDEKDLVDWVESTKQTVFLAVQRNLPEHLSHLVEDVAQETYIQFYKSFHEKKPDPDLVCGWLYVTARNQAKKAIRKDIRENSKILRFAELNMLRTKGKDLHWNSEEIHDALKDLPSPYRETMAYRLLGMSVIEIAKKEGVKLGTIKSRLARGREFLSRLIINQE